MNNTSKIHSPTPISFLALQPFQHRPPLRDLLVAAEQVPLHLLDLPPVAVLLHKQLVVTQVDLVVDVALPELLEEEPSPDPDLLEGGGLLELVDVALTVVDVERVQVVG